MAEPRPDQPESSPPPEAMLRVSGLGKTFVVGFLPLPSLARRASAAERSAMDRSGRRFMPRAIEAVKDLSFEVGRGEIFGLLGPNGSGKTTTIKMLMGLIFPSTGTAEVLGRPVPDIAAKARLGYLPENPAFYDFLRADELLELSAKLCDVPKRERRERIPALIDRVGLGHALDRPLRKFSKGMLQRLGLAQALIHDPDLVILDEPLSGLDPLGRKDLRDLILELREQGKTVMFSSHILSDVEMICDRVGILIRGELRDIGPLGELLSARVRETEIVLKGVDEALRRSLDRAGGQLVTLGERTQIRIPGPVDPTDLLRDAIAAGARVVSVTPRTESLEEHFVRQATAAEPDDGVDREDGRSEEETT